MKFTPRELQVIRLLIERGMSTHEAAWELHISPRTAEVHRNNIMRKVRDALKRESHMVMSPVDLTLYAVTHGLVDLEVIQKRYTECPE